MKYFSKLSVIFASLLFSSIAQASMDDGIRAFEGEDFDQAAIFFTSELKVPENKALSSLYLGKINVIKNENRKAVKYLEVAREMLPENAEAHYWWGAANGQLASSASIFSAPGYAKKCLKGFEKAVELKPDYLEAREGLVNYYLGAPSFMGGSAEKALEQAGAIMKLDRKKGYPSLISVYQSREDSEKVSSLFEDMIKEFPVEPKVYFIRGQYNRQQEKYELAYEDFSKAIALDTGGKEDEETVLTALYFLGAVSQDGKIHLEDGISALENFLKYTDKGLEVFQPWANYRLGVLHKLKGHKDQARKYLKLAARKADDKKLKKKIKRAMKKL